MDRPHAAQLGRRRIGARAERVRTHGNGEMGPLPVHIAVVTAAQLPGGKVDQRVGPPLRSRARFATMQSRD